MSAFNELAKQYATTKNAVDREVREQLKALVAEATSGDDVDKIAALIKGYREGREDIKTDEEAVEDISAQVGPDLSHKLNLGFMHMVQRDGIDRPDALTEEESLAQQVIGMFPPSLAKEYQDSNKIVWALRLALHGK